MKVDIPAKERVKSGPIIPAIRMQAKLHIIRMHPPMDSKTGEI